MDNSATKQFLAFEQGPIRPPSEASSLLIRVNRNCPWNKCTFCSIYKKNKFSTRPIENVIQEIDAVKHFVELLQNGSRSASFKKNLSDGEYQALVVARHWIAGGMESIFLQDADGLVIKPDNLKKILRHLKSCFPWIKRITSYTRSDSVARIPDNELKEIAEAGLNRLHIGMETASDVILSMVRKGVTKQIHIDAGLKVKNAGIQLSEYVLTGIGGREFSQDHAIETADALNQINPDFIRFRTLHLPDKVTLFVDGGDARYQWSPDLVLAKEVLTFLEHLDGITSRIKSDHSYNLFQEIDGVMPKDKERLLGILRTFINMKHEDRVLFQVGKRSGYFHHLSDMSIPGRLEQVEDVCRQAGVNAENADERIHEIVQEKMRMGMPF